MSEKPQNTANPPSSYLERELGKGRHKGWKIADRSGAMFDNEITHMLAVLGGTKPASICPWAEGLYPFSQAELQECAKKNGANFIIYNDPQLMIDGTISIGKELFLYRDRETAKAYINLNRKKYKGEVQTAPYHQEMGRILGYPPEEIAAFSTHFTTDRHPFAFGDRVSYLREHLRPAVYDELAKDPMWEGLLPPRKTRGPGL